MKKPSTTTCSLLSDEHFLQVEEEEQELRASKGDTSSCMWLSDSICPSSCFSSVSRQSDMSDAKCQSDFMSFVSFFFPYASISFIFSRVGSWKRRDRGRFIPPCESGVRGEEDTQL